MLALAVVSTPALSQDGGWFIGAGGGITKFKGACSATAFSGPGSCDDNGTFLKVFGGYQFNAYFGFELGYADFGEMERISTGVGTNTFEAKGFESTLVVTVPFTPAFSIYGKYGLYRWDVDSASTGPAAFTASNTGRDITFGFGAKYDLTKNVALRLEWQRYFDVGDAITGSFDVDASLIGIAIKF
jgi:OOP family OmpA-OmpF porin